MLTKSDLSQIGKLIRDETTPIIQQELAPVKKDVASLKEDVGALKQDVGSLKQDVGGLKKDVGSLKKDMKYVKKTMDVMIDLFDRQDIKLHKRVEKIEDHLGLTTP